MWSVENVGMWSVERVPLDVEWVYNGEHGAKRLCLYGAKSDNGIKKCAPMGRLERKKSYLCCKKAHRSPRGTMTGKAAEESQVVQWRGSIR